MKPKLNFLLFLLFSITSLAQSGGGFNYKALLTDNGNAMNNQTVTIQFTILENATTNVYQETHTTTTDANGIVMVNIGEGTSISGDFTTINWGNNPYFLKVEIDSGSGYDNFGTTEFKAVPYAKYAESGGSVQGLNDLSDATNFMDSVYIGDSAGEDDDGAYYRGNTGVGTYALQHITGGGTSDVEAINNAAFGTMSLYSNTRGYHNTAIGYKALKQNTLGNKNTALGCFAGYKNLGYRNIYIGFNAGYNETGSDKLYIENSDSNTPLIGGNFANDYVNINGKMLVGANDNPTGRLQVIPGNLNNDGSLDMEEAGLLVGTTTNGIAIDNNQIEQIGHDLFLNYNSDTDIIMTQGGGQVKIGGTTPLDKLIVGNNTDSTAVKIVAKDGYKSRLKFFEGNDYGFEFEYDGADDALNLWSKKFAGNEAIRTKWYKNGNVEINGKLTSEATGEANLKPFAYGNVVWNFTTEQMEIKNDTGNFNAYLDNVGVFQIRLYDINGDEISFNFDDYTVIAMVHYNAPVFISSHTYSNRLYFKIYHLNENCTLFTASFSFTIYKK